MAKPKHSRRSRVWIVEIGVDSGDKWYPHDWWPTDTLAFSKKEATAAMKELKQVNPIDPFRIRPYGNVYDD